MKSLDRIKARIVAATPEIDENILAEGTVPESNEHESSLIAASTRLRDFIAHSRTDIQRTVAALEKAIEQQNQILQSINSLTWGEIAEFKVQIAERNQRQLNHILSGRADE